MLEDQQLAAQKAGRPVAVRLGDVGRQLVQVDACVVRTGREAQVDRLSIGEIQLAVLRPDDGVGMPFVQSTHMVGEITYQQSLVTPGRQGGSNSLDADAPVIRLGDRPGKHPDRLVDSIGLS